MVHYAECNFQTDSISFIVFNERLRKRVFSLAIKLTAAAARSINQCFILTRRNSRSGPLLPPSLSPSRCIFQPAASTHNVMRTANPFDGRAFVRSRNDVNPRGAKPPGIFANCQSLIAVKADCPRRESGPTPSPPLFVCCFYFSARRSLRFSVRAVFGESLRKTVG